MPYSAKMLNNHLYSVFFAPRGRDRIYDLGIQIAQMYLSHLISSLASSGNRAPAKACLSRECFPGWS